MNNDNINRITANINYFSQYVRNSIPNIDFGPLQRAVARDDDLTPEERRELAEWTNEVDLYKNKQKSVRYYQKLGSDILKLNAEVKELRGEAGIDLISGRSNIKKSIKIRTELLMAEAKLQNKIQEYNTATTTIQNGGFPIGASNASLSSVVETELNNIRLRLAEKQLESINNNVQNLPNIVELNVIQPNQPAPPGLPLPQQNQPANPQPPPQPANPQPNLFPQQPANPQPNLFPQQPANPQPNLFPPQPGYIAGFVDGNVGFMNNAPVDDGLNLDLFDDIEVFNDLVVDENDFALLVNKTALRNYFGNLPFFEPIARTNDHTHDINAVLNYLSVNLPPTPPANMADLLIRLANEIEAGGVPNDLRKIKPAIFYIDVLILNIHYRNNEFQERALKFLFALKDRLRRYFPPQVQMEQ